MAWAMLQDKYPTRLEVPKEEWESLVNEIEQREKMKEMGKYVRDIGGLMVIVPNATNRVVSTFSFAVVAVVKATQEAADSIYRWKTI